MKGDTTNATVSGTYRYMAPEVYMKKPYDNTVDIYSLGLVLYWLLNNRRMPYLPTDRVPKASENEAALEKRMSGQRMERPLNGSDALKDVVMKACAYNRKDRYQRAGEMKLALKNILNGRANRGRTEEVWKSGSTYFETEETVGAATAGTATAGASATNYSYRTKTEPEVTVGNSWNDGGETVGARQGTSKAGESFYRDETVGEVPSHKRNAKTESVKTKSAKAEKDKKDYVLRYEGRHRETVYFMEKGTIDNPFIIAVDSEGASKESTTVIEGREITIPAWPSLDCLYYKTESDGTKVYYKTILRYYSEIPRWVRIVAGILLLMGTLHFYPILGPFCIVTVLFAFILFRDPEKAARNKYEKEWMNRE